MAASPLSALGPGRGPIQIAQRSHAISAQLAGQPPLPAKPPELLIRSQTSGSERNAKQSREEGGKGSHASQLSPSVRPKKKQSVPPPECTISKVCTFMDEEWQVCEAEVRKVLLDRNPDFTVVVIVGAQGAGKSTTAALLLAPYLQHKLNEKSTTVANPSGSAEEKNDLQLPDVTSSLAAFLDGSAARAGVDLCVSTLDRLLLLDVQSLFNYDVMSEMEVRSELHFILFLVSICNAFVAVTDIAADIQLLKFLRSLGMLKSRVPDFLSCVDAKAESPGGIPQPPSQKDALPRLVVVLNDRPGYSNSAVATDPFRPMKMFLEHSPWQACPSVDYVRLPQFPGERAHSMLGSAQARQSGQQLRECILARGPGKGHRGMTETQWLQNVVSYWETVQQASVVQEYLTSASVGLDNYSWPEFP